MLRSRGLSTTAVIRNVRFYEGMETVGIYSDFSRSAVDAAFHAFIDDGGTSEHESFWKSVT